MNPPLQTRRGVLFTVCVLVVALLVVFLASRPDPRGQAERLVRRAMLLAAQGQMSEAEDIARQAIQLDDRFVKAYRLAAECAVARSDFDQALNDLAQIPGSEHGDWLSGRRLAAEILHKRVYRLRDAERAYLDVLAASPDDVQANDGYARLLGICGRRSEAVPHVLKLIRAGEETDLLVMLSRESGTLNDPEMLKAACKADPTDPNPLLGQAAIAVLSLKPAIALQKLKRAEMLEGLPTDFQGRLGRQLLDNQRFAELDEWRRNLSVASMSAECWLVLAELADRSNDHRGAIRAYWEALKLRPESLKATNQLARKLARDGQTELAAPFSERVERINRLRDLQRAVIMSDERPSSTELAAMIQAYRSVGRLWEAFAWAKLALKNHPQNPELQEVMQSLDASILTLPFEMTFRDSNPAYQIDLSRYPIPSFRMGPVEVNQASASENISFKQQRTEIGFDFQYFDGTEGTTWRMFELTGCGLAVIDFDNDAAPDVYCVQGRSWGLPASQSSSHSDRLFRNIDARQFVEVSELSKVLPEECFGQGASVGDINNDGFADIYVANIGPNKIVLNNGDGTFSVDSSFQASLTGRTLSSENQTDQWTTSCLVVDLNGDTFPDLYDVNYLSGEGLFDRVCKGDHGDTIQCPPNEFTPALDQLWLGDGAGGFIADTDFLNPHPRGQGLGAVAMNAGNGRLSLFVSNDTTANFFFTPSGPDARTLSESAVAAGLAFNGDGKAEASMGIAVADCTQDGKLDLLVTNFLYESNTLYSQIGDFVFEDKTRDLGLHDPTLKVLGWGTQFLDANIDGRLEAFVINGHTQNLSKYGTPYGMRPQMFEWVVGGFHELPTDQLGVWSSVKTVGRTVARLDWNQDGKADLVVGLMDAPHYILENTSDTAANGFLSLRLVATESARDAIGATVTVDVGSSQFLHQLTAGDGYASCNERRLLIGCGTSSVVDRLTVKWPSGTTQVFSDVATSQSAIVVEGRETLAVIGH